MKKHHRQDAHVVRVRGMSRMDLSPIIVGPFATCSVQDVQEEDQTYGRGYCTSILITGVYNTSPGRPVLDSKRTLNHGGGYRGNQRYKRSTLANRHCSH